MSICHTFRYKLKDVTEQRTVSLDLVLLSSFLDQFEEPFCTYQ